MFKKELLPLLIYEFIVIGKVNRVAPEFPVKRDFLEQLEYEVFEVFDTRVE